MHKYKNYIIASVLVVSCFGLMLQAESSGLVAAKPSVASANETAAASEKKEVKLDVETLLNKKVSHLSFVNTKFVDVIKCLQENGLNVVAIWSELESNYPDIRTDQISINLKGVTYRAFLEAVLKEAARGYMDIGYYVDSGCIYINTKEQINTITICRIYDISDLIAAPRYLALNSESMPPHRLHENRYDEYGDPVSSTPLQTMSHGERILKMIKDTVDYDSWYPSGNARIISNGGALVVTQTYMNHRKIKAFVELLRKNKPKRSVLRTWLVKLSKEQVDALQAKQKGREVVAVSREEMLKMDVRFQGQVSSYDLQWVCQFGGESELVVTGMDLIVSENIVGYRPITRMVQWGPVLEMRTAPLKGQGDKVRMQLNVNYSQKSTDKEATPIMKLRPNDPPRIQPLRYYNSILKCDVVLPLNKPVFVGGLRGGNADTQFFLFVEVVR